MVVKLDNDKCTGCGKCVDACAVGAIIINETRNKAVVDEDQCLQCGVCIDECPTEALSMG